MGIFLGNSNLASSGGSGGGGGGQINTYASFHLFPTSPTISTQLEVDTTDNPPIDITSVTGMATGETWTVFDDQGVLRGTIRIGGFQGGGSFQYQTINSTADTAHVYYLGLGDGVYDVNIVEGDFTDVDRWTPNWNPGTGIYTPTDGGTYLATGKTLRDTSNAYPQATPNTASHSEELATNLYDQNGSVHSFYHPPLRTFFVTGSGSSANGPEANISMGAWQHPDGDLTEWEFGWGVTTSLSPPSQLGRNTPYQLSGAGSLDRTFLYTYDVFADRLLAFQARNNGTAAGTGGYIIQNNVTIDVSSQLQFNDTFGSFTNWVELDVTNSFATDGNDPIESTNNGSTFKLEVDPINGEIYIHYVADGGASIVRSFNTDGSSATTFTPVAGSPAQAFTTEARVSPVNNNGATEWWWQFDGDWFMSTGFNVAGTMQFNGGIVNGTTVNPQSFEAFSPTQFIGFQDDGFEGTLYLTTPQLVRTLGDGTIRTVTFGTPGINDGLAQTVFYKIN